MNTDCRKNWNVLYTFLVSPLSWRQCGFASGDRSRWTDLSRSSMKIILSARLSGRLRYFCFSRNPYWKDKSRKYNLLYWRHHIRRISGTCIFPGCPAQNGIRQPDHRKHDFVSAHGGVCDPDPEFSCCCDHKTHPAAWKMDCLICFRHAGEIPAADRPESGGNI